jgi:hypothetical protein
MASAAEVFAPVVFGPVVFGPVVFGPVVFGPDEYKGQFAPKMGRAAGLATRDL